MENSKIEWTHHTFNPWIGCARVSAGCKNCYAEELMANRYKKVRWGVGGTRVRTSAENWRKPHLWNKQAAKLGIRYRVFCASLADVFEDKLDQPEMDDWRADLMRMISATPNLDWLLLTKRPENVMPEIIKSIKLINSDRNAKDLMVAMEWLGWVKHGGSYALPNVWIGTSVEDQEQADKRIPELLHVPARVRFLSMEPLLGSVDLAQAMGDTAWKRTCRPIENQDDPNYNRINWVIVGGESGRDARPMNPDWARSVRDQCQEAGVPFFMKQMGGNKKPFAEIPADLMIREFPQNSTRK